MAATKPRPVADAAAALASSLATARELIPQPDATLPAMISAGGTPDSNPPWNPRAAAAVLDAHAGVRALEQGLRLAVTGRTLLRGGSDGNTDHAIGSIVRLAEAVHRPHDGTCKRKSRCDECRIAGLLSRWTSAALALPAIDEIARWQPIRASPRPACPDCGTRPCPAHAHPPACPYCDTFSLRAAPDRTPPLVACFNPQCEDENEEPPVAHLELSRLNAEPLLVWGDGRIQCAA